jgi:hypothetical protein
MSKVTLPPLSQRNGQTSTENPFFVFLRSSLANNIWGVGLRVYGSGFSAYFGFSAYVLVPPPILAHTPSFHPHPRRFAASFGRSPQAPALVEPTVVRCVWRSCPDRAPPLVQTDHGNELGQSTSESLRAGCHGGAGMGGQAVDSASLCSRRALSTHEPASWSQIAFFKPRFYGWIAVKTTRPNPYTLHSTP